MKRAPRLDPRAIAAAIRSASEVAGQDDEFDRLFPFAVRRMSRIHWTPLQVAHRVVDWLAPAPGELMLDVGSGVGKLCLVGALRTSAQWCGLECRRDLVTAAEHAARVLDVAHQATFIATDAATFDWSRCDGVYLYNPFGEMLMAPDHATLATVGALAPLVRTERRHAHDQMVEMATAKLEELRPGTRVVTFHGFGGDYPDCLELVARETVGTGPVELLVKRSGVPRRRRPAPTADPRLLW